MKINIRQIKKHRSYSKQFKPSLVKDYESGQYSVVQLEKLQKVKRFDH